MKTIKTNSKKLILLIIIMTLSIEGFTQITLNLKFFIFGYGNGSGTMVPVLFNQGESISITDVDHVTITLRDATPAHNIMDTYIGILQTNGELQCTFNNTAAFNQNLYIVLDHRNGFQTWSASPILTPLNGGSYSYNFSDAAAKAYASNQIQIQFSPNIFATYNGDINQNGHSDLADYIELLEAIRDFVFGFEVTDLNGDGNVDLLDMPIFENIPFIETEIPN